MGNTKLAIGVPLVDKTVPAAFLDSFVIMQKPNFVYLRPQYSGMNIAEIRNQLVERALDNGCTHLLMMDSDQVYAPDTIIKLLAHDKTVVSAIVHRRYPGFDPILYRGIPGRYIHISDEEILDSKEEKNLIEIDATGCGCVLYNTEVFLKIDPPWFEFGRDEQGSIIGEDIGFCYKLKQNGYRIFCDPTIDIGHLSTLEINWGTYALYKHLKKLEKMEG